MNPLYQQARRHAPLGIAVLSLGLLLFALQSVLQQSVQRGLSLRKAAATEADSAWRCGVLRGRPTREQCPPASPAPR